MDLIKDVVRSSVKVPEFDKHLKKCVHTYMLLYVYSYIHIYKCQYIYVYAYVYLCIYVCVSLSIYIYIYICIYICLIICLYLHICVWACVYTYILGVFNKFRDFFIQAFKIDVDTWKFSMLLLYILWDDRPIYTISGSNEQLQQQLEYILLKPDCHSWGISKMQSGRYDTLEERYAITFCFKLGKNATETPGMLHTAFGASCLNRASVFEWHKRFKEDRESVRDNEVWEELGSQYTRVDWPKG